MTHLNSFNSYFLPLLWAWLWAVRPRSFLVLDCDFSCLREQRNKRINNMSTIMKCYNEIITQWFHHLAQAYIQAFWSITTCKIYDSFAKNSMYLTINIIIYLAFLLRNIEPFSKHSLIYSKFTDCCELGGIILRFLRLSTFFCIATSVRAKKEFWHDIVLIMVNTVCFSIVF